MTIVPNPYATIPYLGCLCGAREDDHGQERPRKCWHCGERAMGRFDRGRG